MYVCILIARASSRGLYTHTLYLTRATLDSKDATLNHLAFVRKRAQLYIHTHMCMCVRVCMDAYVHMYIYPIYVCMHAYIYRVNPTHPR